MRTVACFGDSLIFGFPYGPKESWIAEVEAETGVTMLNYGVCGDCCDDIVYRLKNMYLSEQVEAVLFWGGANDILNGRPQGFVIDDLKRAAEFCAAKKWPLAFVLPLFSADDDFNARAELLRRRMQLEFGGKVFLLDLQEAVGETDRELQAAYFDGIHPTIATYKKLGMCASQLLAGWLKGE